MDGLTLKTNRKTNEITTTHERKVSVEPLSDGWVDLKVEFPRGPMFAVELNEHEICALMFMLENGRIKSKQNGMQARKAGQGSDQEVEPD
jgi:hypothetical protein